MNKTSIEWTHRPETRGVAGGFTWNPIRARIPRYNPIPPRKGQPENFKTGTFCTRISPGCKNCYASVINKRFGTGAEYTVPNLADREFYIDEKILTEPLKRKKPATIFVGDMFDLFHEAIPEELIENVFLSIVQAKQHTFQILTKRAERMQKWVSCRMYRPHPHIWFGVSVEDEQRARERVTLLLQTPAAVRFLSVEPQLEAIDLLKVAPDLHDMRTGQTIDWVICGGESGPGARPFNLAWAESLLGQCRAAGVPFFMKQTGSNATSTIPHRHGDLTFRYTGGGVKRDRKGGDPAEWPKSLRVREFPEWGALRKAAHK